MVNLIKIKEVVTSISGLHEILTVLLIATILTIFEIILFFKIIAPGVKKTINNTLAKTGKTLGSIIYNKENSVLIDMVPSEIRNYIEIMIDNDIIKPDAVTDNNLVLDIAYTLRDREKSLTDDINRYTFISSILLVIILVIIIGLIIYTITRTNKINKSAILAAFVTVAILIAFQYNFYQLGKEYKYTGSMGNDEYLKIIIDKLEEQ